MPTETHPSETDIQHEADQASVIAGNNTADAFFGKLDAKSRLYAKKLHAAGVIYALYGALDGLSLSYSTIKYCFDVFLTNSPLSPSDTMHDWLLTPAGIAVAATESITIIGFSLLANLFDDHKDDKDKNFKRFIAVLWPYVRDVLKGLKNGYKGVRSAVQLTNMLGGVNVNFLILPVGLLLSGLAVLNRLWYRHMTSLRKDMMVANAEILAKINSKEPLTPEKIAEYRAIVKKNSQSKMLRTKGLLSAAYSGIVDSLYLYVGVLGLCSIAWPALIAMSVFCVIYSISCVLTRVYEEYDFQRKLLILHAKIDLALYTRENSESMQKKFKRLNKISLKIAEGNHTKELLSKQSELAIEMLEKVEILTAKRAHLQSLMTLSNTSAFLAGVKNGLAAYSALTSIMFALSIIFLLTSTSFPPALLITCVSAGFVLLMAFGMHSLIKHYRHRVKQEVANKPYERLMEALKSFKAFNKDSINANLGEDVKKAVDDGLQVQSAPSFFFQEWFEVVRSFFSGLGKGSKSVDYAFNPLQEAGTDGHYHDTPVMMILAVFSSIVYAVGMALRALARGFGRDPIDKVALPENGNNPASENKEAEKVEEIPSPVSKPFSVLPDLAFCAEPVVPASSPSQGSGAVGQDPDSPKIPTCSPLRQYSIFPQNFPVPSQRPVGLSASI